MKPKLYLIDGSSYIFRAFYEIPEFLSNFKRLPTSALYGFIPLIVILVLWFPSAGAAEDIKMKDVRILAKLKVDGILKERSVLKAEVDHYWETVHKRDRPLIVFFYINQDSGSQRVATLIHYVAPDYKDRIQFRRIEVQGEGKPSREIQKDLQKRFGLDDVPGILFYDNVKGEMVLEEEDYIDADFKEFRTPGMIFWKRYLSGIRKELDELLAD